MAYSELSINTCFLGSHKHFIPPVPTRDSDRVVRKEKQENDDGELEETLVYLYVIPARTMLRRLNVAGFTYDALEKDFQANVKLRSEWAREVADEDENAADDLKLLKKASLKTWLRALKAVVTKTGASASERIEQYLTHYPGSYIGQMYDEMLPFGTLNWPTSTYYYYLRAVAEVVPLDFQFELDVTDFAEDLDFEDIAPTAVSIEMPKSVFNDAMSDVDAVLPLVKDNPALGRLLYANIITAFETYLSDTARRGVLSKNALLRRFLETNAPKGETVPISQIVARYEGIEEYVATLLDKISFHNIDTAIKIFGDVLLVSFPKKSVDGLKKAVHKRHDIVHRNGRQHSGKRLSPSVKEIETLRKLIITTVGEIDEQIKESLLDTHEF